MVSIIMPVYNAEKFLKETVESMLNQTYTNFEFLIFNDGSTDGSLAILQQYTDPRIRLIHSDQNKGYLHWLNAGITESKGKYIARMDSDDISMPDRLEKQVHFLEQNSHIAIVGTGIVIFNDKTGEKPYHSLSSGQEIKWGLIFKNRLIHPSVMMRREVIISSGILYRQEFYGSEDYRFWTEAIQHNLSVTNIPSALLKYRDHGNNFTKTNRDRQIDNSKRIAKDYLTFLLPAISESKAGEMVEKIYSAEPGAIVSLFHDFRTVCKQNELELLIPFLRDCIVEQFFRIKKCTLRDVVLFRRKLSVVPGGFYADGKRQVIIKHYIKLKLGRSKKRTNLS
ncbi:MAG: glycosyltransferase family 2 protein [Bacteroidetes bacterium]|nr:glycosyltransferase family 2 protein [Bacteroidota bacterium]